MNHPSRRPGYRTLLQISAIEHIALHTGVRCPSHEFLLDLHPTAVYHLYERRRYQFRQYLRAWLRRRQCRRQERRST